MKLYRVNRKCLALIGIRPRRSDETSNINFHNVVVFIIFGLCSISTTVFFLYEAKTFQEHAESFFACATVTALYGGFVLNLINAMDVFRCIELLEKLIEKRNFKLQIVMKSNLVYLLYSSFDQI